MLSFSSNRDKFNRLIPIESFDISSMTLKLIKLCQIEHPGSDKSQFAFSDRNNR